jgi:hypothetical protein
MNDTDDGLSREQDENKLKFCKRWGPRRATRSPDQRDRTWPPMARRNHCRLNH